MPSIVIWYPYFKINLILKYTINSCNNYFLKYITDLQFLNILAYITNENTPPGMTKPSRESNYLSSVLVFLKLTASNTKIITRAWLQDFKFKNVIVSKNSNVFCQIQEEYRSIWALIFSKLKSDSAFCLLGLLTRTG